MRRAAGPQDPYAAMLRGALAPTALVAAGCVLVSALVSVGALAGAGLAAVVVVVFFSASLLVMRRTARTAPHNVMAVALVTYITKVGLLGVLLLVFQDATWLSGTAFAATALLSAAVWLVAEIRAYSRVRLLVYGGVSDGPSHRGAPPGDPSPGPGRVTQPSPGREIP